MHDDIVERMESYAAAWRALDAERLIAFYVDDALFRYYDDGRPLSRKELVGAVTQVCRTARHFDATWHGLEITPLGADAALAASQFTRIIQDESGESTEDWGAVTWVWTRRGGEWKIIHGQGVHYPGALPPD